MMKSLLRATMAKLNHSKSGVDRNESATNIFSKIEQLPIYGESSVIALFLALDDEVETLSTASRWRELGKRVVVPRVVGEEMDFVDFSPELLRKGAFGILEPTSECVVRPEEIDLMIAPGVAFCRDGRRLGRGRGYYDRYLAQKSFRAYTIGVGYAHQLTYDIPCEAHDQRLNLVITPLEESPIPNIVWNIVNSAGKAAIKIGCGVERLIEQGISWVLLRLKLEFVRTPEANEPLEIETYISDFNRITTTRNFIIRDANGEQIGVAISQWCLIDLEARRALDFTHLDNNYKQFVEDRPRLLELSRRIPAVGSDADSKGIITEYTHLASQEDIDFNRHVNTMRYIDLMVEMLPAEQISARTEFCFDIQFLHETRLGELLTIRREEILNIDDSDSPSSHTLSLFEILAADGNSAVRATLK